jgi:hypothetical protein
MPDKRHYTASYIFTANTRSAKLRVPKTIPGKTKAKLRSKGKDKIASLPTQPFHGGRTTPSRIMAFIFILISFHQILAVLKESTKKWRLPETRSRNLKSKRAVRGDWHGHT